MRGKKSQRLRSNPPNARWCAPRVYEMATARDGPWGRGHLALACAESATRTVASRQRFLPQPKPSLSPFGLRPACAVRSPTGHNAHWFEGGFRHARLSARARARCPRPRVRRHCNGGWEPSLSGFAMNVTSEGEHSALRHAPLSASRQSSMRAQTRPLKSKSYASSGVSRTASSKATASLPTRMRQFSSFTPCRMISAACAGLTGASRYRSLRLCIAAR